MKHLLFFLLSVIFTLSFAHSEKHRFNIGEIKSTWKARHHQDGPEEDGVLFILKVTSLHEVSVELLKSYFNR